VRRRFDPYKDFPVADDAHSEAVAIECGARPRGRGGRIVLTVTLGTLGAVFGVMLGVMGGYTLTHGGSLGGFLEQFPGMPADATMPAEKAVPQTPAGHDSQDGAAPAAAGADVHQHIETPPATPGR